MRRLRVLVACEFYPFHLKYMDENNIKLDGNFSIRFECVLGGK